MGEAGAIALDMSGNRVSSANSEDGFGGWLRHHWPSLLWLGVSGMAESWVFTVSPGGVKCQVDGLKGAYGVYRYHSSPTSQKNRPRRQRERKKTTTTTTLVATKVLS